MTKRVQERLACELYARHAAAVYPHALTLAGGDRTQAHALLRTALLNAVRRPAGRVGADLAGWLADEMRRLSVRRPRFGLWRRRRGVAASPAPGRPPARPGSELPIADTLAGLPPEHRAALVETFLKGRKVRQAAEVLGLPPEAVKSRLYYGLHRLALAIEEQESAW
ncbi:MULTISPECIES: sigma factor-like helix-turn-helix DNA-binding protein [unclassified Kitasatospora]|uniref:sigma factor-like helix-turn-helix DNA-binding protein n=1 Tax=unclassified Kitasatospora TaxID=2633591 RepID=UPI003404C996